MQSVSFDDPMKWITSDNERIRMLRYFVRSQMNPALRLRPDYPPEPKIGAVIGTYGCAPYVDLNLHHLVNANRLPVLIHDDCSDEQPKLLEVCKRYYPKVQMCSTEKRMWHHSGIGAIGDTSSIAAGLEWAKMNKLDILVKFSRRFVCVSEFATRLKALALASDAFTFGLDCAFGGLPLRTECVAFNVKAWTQPWVSNCLNSLVKGRVPIFAEFWFYDMAHTIAYGNGSEKYREFMRKQNRGPMADCYAAWRDLLPPSRREKSPNALWHQVDAVEDYAAAAEAALPGRYKVDDFRNVEEI